ncbi:MAG: hypothetical protein CMC40_02100 [Flavobacteriaceae bacterium]|jgi:uncharacterized membrane protein|nr:hypothetical protein [Flavobacteriaceae bacterium]|tara:strand:- start:152 stop:412 length:261 start_codon:yes stop_codon:yes gene_type:complete
MEITISPYIIWNLIITVIIAPLGFLIRNVLSEQKRLDILVNKTREEIAKDYATREQIEADFVRIQNTLNKIDEKLDRLQHKTYFQE